MKPAPGEVFEAVMRLRKEIGCGSLDRESAVAILVNVFAMKKASAEAVLK